MNNISQISIFDYRKIENLGDFENIEDEKLCEMLEKEMEITVAQSLKSGTNEKTQIGCYVNL